MSIPIEIVLGLLGSHLLALFIGAMTQTYVSDLIETKAKKYAQKIDSERRAVENLLEHHVFKNQ